MVSPYQMSKVFVPLWFTHGRIRAVEPALGTSRPRWFFHPGQSRAVRRVAPRRSSRSPDGCRKAE